MTADVAYRVVVNGCSLPWRDGWTVLALVAELKVPPAGVAVERNAELVRRAEWEQVELAPGDVVEVVALVGGG